MVLQLSIIKTSHHHRPPHIFNPNPSHRHPSSLLIQHGHPSIPISLSPCPNSTPCRKAFLNRTRRPSTDFRGRVRFPLHVLPSISDAEYHAARLAQLSSAYGFYENPGPRQGDYIRTIERS